jgi:endo-1,4-beta-xylanase
LTNKSLSLALAFILHTAVVSNSAAQTLRQRADKAGVLVGAAVDPRRFGEPPYAATLAREFNMVEPENVLKWGTLRPTRDRFDFRPGDRVVAFARAHGMKVRGHCLLWSEYNPAWLEKGDFTPQQLNAMLREHVTKVMRHYAGKVFAWDVVNESFLADGQVESSVWYDKPGIGMKGQGTAYVEQAFRWARAADPGALLFYNDYDVEGINPKSDAVYAMVKDFRARGVPIDGVGFQAHVFDKNLQDLETMPQNLARFAALGVQIHITEMDVALPVDSSGKLVNPSDLARQADIYRRIASACFQQPRCTAFQTWGFTDRYTWIPEYTKGAQGAPLPFDRDYAPKPAYRAVLDALDLRRRPARSRRR